MDPVFIFFCDRINRIFYYSLFITFQKKVMKPNPLRGISGILKNVSAARRIVFPRFHPETVKEKKKIL
jgi:hypothetical protein